MKFYRQPWFIWGIICSFIIGIAGILRADTKTSGYAADQYFNTTTKTTRNGTLTTGYTHGGLMKLRSNRIRLKTRKTPTGTITRGYINGKYVRIREKKDG
jgi:hypothetical protein